MYELRLTTSELRTILIILKAFKEGLLVNIDQEWELDEYGERLVSSSRVVDKIIQRLETSLPEEQAKEIQKTILLRKYHPYHDQVDERVYSILNRAFQSKRRVEIDYFSMEIAEITKREVDIYYISRRYIIGFDHLRNDIRKFRVSRVINARIKKEGYEIPIGFDKHTYK